MQGTVILMFFISVFFLFPIGAIMGLSYLAERQHEENCGRQYTAVRYTPCPSAERARVYDYEPKASMSEKVSEQEPEYDIEPEPVLQPEPEPELKKPINLTDWVEINSDMLLHCLEDTGEHILETNILNGMDVEDVRDWLLEQDAVSIVQQAPDGISFVVEERRD